jgi:GT2 family glycosyltransferase
MGNRSAGKFQEQTVSLPPECVPGKIGVVTVTYGSGQVLPDFFVSLDKQTYRNFVLIAVDNQSKDSTVEQLNVYRGCETAVIVNDRNLGVAVGNNQGICEALQAGCEFVLLLNNDVSFGAELFQQLVDGLIHYRCQMTTPTIYYYDRPDVIWCAGCSLQRWAGMRLHHRGGESVDRGQFDKPARVSSAPTCCILFRREVFAAIGLMDEAYFVYMDDVDFLYRAWKSDLVLYCVPEAKLWHKVSSLTGGESPFTIRYTTRNRAYFTAKHLKGLSFWLASASYHAWYLFLRIRGRYDKSMLRCKLDYWTEGLRLAQAERNREGGSQVSEGLPPGGVSTRSAKPYTR